MAESLGCISHLLTRNSHLFREHPQVIRVRQNIVKVREGEFPDIRDGDIEGGGLYISRVTRLATLLQVESPRLHSKEIIYPGHGLNEPESNHDKGALASAHTCTT